MRLRLLSIGLAGSMIVSSYGLEIIGHRGASYDAPENTLAAFKLSFEQGADATELDVHLTKDGKIAVFHDYDLKRCAGTNLVLSNSTLAELQGFNIARFGKWTNDTFHEKIPTLSEVFPLVPPGKRVVIEIKCHSEILPALGEAMAESRLGPEQLPIITFHYDVARDAKQRFPKHEVFWLHSWAKDKQTGEYPKIENLIQKAREAKLDGLDLNYQFPIDKAFVRQVHEAGLKLYTWTVNDIAVAQAERDAGVDGITTDRPRWLRAGVETGN
jgi:glycerophosphoryl diester phosphodiesterase